MRDRESTEGTVLKVGSVSGTQLAFFTFALLLLTVPLTDWAAKVLGAEGVARSLLGRALIFLPAGIIVFGIPTLRRQALALVRPRIPPARMAEVLTVTAANALLFGLAASGALALWEWAQGGDAMLLRRIEAQPPQASQMARALSPIAIVHLVFIACLLAPILEELVIRGFLYRAWERQWGVWPSMLLTSALFGLYHKHFFAAFASGLILASLMRRTGTLRSSITAHAVFNLSLWYPLMGQFIVPRVGFGEGLAAWTVHLVALGLSVVLIPYYVWLASKGGRITESRAG